jgi:hypothetical protein
MDEDLVRFKSLLEDGTTSVPTLRFRWQKAELFNAFDARDSDVDYFYRSRLRGEPSDGVA